VHREQLQPKAYIKEMGTFGTQYAGAANGALTFLVDVENPQSTTIPAVQVNWAWQLVPTNPALASSLQDKTNWGYGKTKDLKPGSNEFAITPNEAIPVCGYGQVMINLFPEGSANLENVWRHTQVHTSNCSYSATFGNPWNQMEPDRVDAQKAGVVYVNNAVMTKPPVCGTSDWTEVRFDLVNRAGKDGSLMVDITDPNGTLPLAEQGVNIKNGQSISPIITMFRPTRTGKLAIKLVGSDWQGKNPIPVVNPGAWLDFEGTCTVSVDPVK
jgi:hypothetical protein